MKQGAWSGANSKPCVEKQGHVTADGAVPAGERQAFVLPQRYHLPTKPPAQGLCPATRVPF